MAERRCAPAPVELVLSVPHEGVPTDLAGSLRQFLLLEVPLGVRDDCRLSTLGDPGGRNRHRTPFSPVLVSSAQTPDATEP
jgi:hypothetical protein